MKRCNECKGEILCDDCKNQVNEKNEANLNLIKQKAPKQFGHMLPYFKERAGLIVTVRLLYILFSFFSYYFFG